MTAIKNHCKGDEMGNPVQCSTDNQWTSTSPDPVLCTPGASGV